ncbi:MAG: hypothetical protein HRU38_13500 [Saccharospirillaceae bacterium]|nr:hypothetical protein [Pseudomonadales bacterium]NRB79659.1 hypothetical protein [Saccharospirillaceae bacterium]
MIKLFLKHIHAVNEHIQQLEFDYDHSIEFHAGQYLELVIAGQENLYFTIASSPSEQRLILLIENKTATLIEQYCQDNNFVESKHPQGECHIHNFAKPFKNLILVASGSGFSQMRAICQDIILNNKDIKVTFIWGSAEFFEEELMKTWKDKVNIVLHKIEDIDIEGKNNKHEQLMSLCLENITTDLNESAVIACASPDLVYPLQDALVEKGLGEHMMLADVFQFMPRQ